MLCKLTWECKLDTIHPNNTIAILILLCIKPYIIKVS